MGRYEQTLWTVYLDAFHGEAAVTPERTRSGRSQAMRNDPPYDPDGTYRAPVGVTTSAPTTAATRGCKRAAVRDRSYQDCCRGHATLKHGEEWCV